MLISILSPVVRRQVAKDEEGDEGQASHGNGKHASLENMYVILEKYFISHIVV